MRKSGKYWSILFMIFLLNSCQDEAWFPITEGKLKTKFTYASSKDKEPYAYTDYYYDQSWNVIKEITIVKPDPVTFKNTYKYLDGKLIEKCHYGIPQGSSSNDLTEFNLTLYDKYLYAYPSVDVEIETHYDMKKNFLKDSTIYEYMGELLIKESHYDGQANFVWGKEYEYDQGRNLVKEIEYPDGRYTVYSYKNGKKTKVVQYDKHNALIVENNYVYKTGKGYETVEVHYSGPYGKHVSSKSFYKNGLLVELIRYHPTFIGEEWACYRYEYY